MFSINNSKIDTTALTRLLNKLGHLLFENDLVIDSREVRSRSIFFAYPGLRTDGRKYIEGAIANGVKAVVYEGDFNIAYHDNILHIGIPNIEHYIGLIASKKYHDPSKKFLTIGVTGTNGKTSITYWLNQAYLALGKTAAIIGTTGSGIYPQIKDYGYTTPYPITLQQLLTGFAKHHVEILAMEVSSHALHQGRVNGIAYTTAIFTNLTQDHLDYHETMEGYYLAKRDLFYWHGLKNAIINIDDSYGRRLVEDLNKNNKQVKIITYGINRGDLFADEIKITLDKMQFCLNYAGQMQQVTVKVIGRFNVYNLLAVTADLILNGHTLAEIAHLLPKLDPVCGRMHAIRIKDKPLVVIDYSHTPDSLKNVLNTLKEVEHRGKLYCVFGCGGNRDTIKRPQMGQIATDIADFTFITSDNPRYENPEEIINQIKVGIESKTNYTAITDRKDAIKQAIANANSDDIILIAGKGHETYQEINGIKNDFSDYEIAKQLLDA